MPKFSEIVINHAIHFMRSIEHEMGEIGREKVLAMLDAFDPDFRDEMVMTLFIHGDNMPVTVYLKRNPSYSSVQKINAIKAVRLATGYGLREAKDAVDIADDFNVSSPIEVTTYQAKIALIEGLKGTGYEI